MAVGRVNTDVIAGLRSRATGDAAIAPRRPGAPGPIYRIAWRSENLDYLTGQALRINSIQEQKEHFHNLQHGRLQILPSCPAPSQDLPRHSVGKAQVRPRDICPEPHERLQPLHWLQVVQDPSSGLPRILKIKRKVELQDIMQSERHQKISTHSMVVCNIAAFCLATSILRIQKKLLQPGTIWYFSESGMM